MECCLQCCCPPLTALSLLAQEGASQRNGAASHLELHFALEIAGTALLGHLPNGDITRYEVLFKDCLLPGYQHAINCVYGSSQGVSLGPLCYDSGGSQVVLKL